MRSAASSSSTSMGSASRTNALAPVVLDAREAAPDAIVARAFVREALPMLVDEDDAALRVIAYDGRCRAFPCLRR